MSFTDGVSQMRQGRIVKAIDMAPGQVSQDQFVIKWDNTSQSFQLIAQSALSIDIGQLTGTGFAMNQYPQWNGSKFIPVTLTSSTSEVQFLASQAALGNLITVAAKVTGTNVVIAYTVPNGKTFTLYQATGQIILQGSTAVAVMDLRNNGTIVAKMGAGQTVTASADVAQVMNFPVKGDQLVGNGAKTYDLNFTQGEAADQAIGSICGYIA